MSVTSFYDRPLRRTAEGEQDFGKDHSLNYILAFVALGTFVSLMAIALNPLWLEAAGW